MDRSISWGNYPKHSFSFTKFDANHYESNFVKNSIPFGNGRSYGDSCISDHIIGVNKFNHFLKFDPYKGILRLQSGVLLEDIIKVVLPMGWFLKVSPGTKLITVGGAIAADVHGKNHHLEGCFSEAVNWFTLLLPSGEIIKCSRAENTAFFYATCGGMGLTGIILEAEIILKKVHSKYINQTTRKTRNLQETFEVFDSIKNEPYSVAWIDCLSKGDDLGRSVVKYGNFVNDGDLNYVPKRKINIPFHFPPFILNTYSVKLFNWYYYNQVSGKGAHKKVDIDSFFFPLDAIGHWNRLYGKNGFTQYQFILPKEMSFAGLQLILAEINRSGKGSFLAVLKLYGKENDNYISFPMEGYSLALDFKIEKGLFHLLDRLDKIVVNFGGRIYLAKDARVSKATFEKGYPKINLFRELRRKYKLNEVLSSLQSQRVGI